MRLAIILLILGFGIWGGGTNLFAQEYSSKKSDEIITENGQKYYMHQVTKGNTVYNISKTYNVPGNIILQYNPDLNNGLREGMILKIPFIKEQEAKFIYHIVKDQETLYQISKIYNVRVEDIKQLNKMNSENINKGQYLKIPSIHIKTNTVLLNEKAGDGVRKQNGEQGKYVNYRVQPKETLFSISKRFGISVDALMYLNDMKSPQLSSGQVLLIPRKLIEKQANASLDTEKFIQHKVKAKETLYGIARQYAVSIAEIEKVNNINKRQIRIGELLKIPRKLNETAFITHNVTAKREKLKKIASEYNISVLELKQANPKAPTKLRKGQSIRIPLNYIETDFETENINIVESPDVEVIESEEEIKVVACQKNETQAKKYHIAFMLPLYLDQVDSLMTMSFDELMENAYSKPFKFIEFYEGAYLAAQEMRDMGMDFELHIYDVPRDEEVTKEVLKKAELRDMDMIISLTYTKNFELISEFSKKYHIPLVNAISKRRKIIYDNENVFKIEPNEGALYDDIINYVIERYSDYNIILLGSNPYQFAKEFKNMQSKLEKQLPLHYSIQNAQIIDDINAYTERDEKLPPHFNYTIKKSLSADLPDYHYDSIMKNIYDTTVFNSVLKTVVYSIDSLRGIANASSLFRKNLIIALGNDEVFAIEMLTQLNSVRGIFDYEVIGLPYWNEYQGIDVEYSQPLKLQMVNKIFVDYSKPEVKNFVLNFRSQFGIEPETNRYAFLGYDVTKYFLTALKDYGTNFQNCLKYMDVELLENQLHFRHLPNTGYENINWNIIQQRNYKYHLMN